MKRIDLIDRLMRLAELEADVLRIYERAIEQMGRVLRADLTRFRGDHQRHLDTLSAAIRRLGEKAPAPLRVARVDTPAAGPAGGGSVHDALQSLRDAALRANRAYSNALSGDVPSEIGDLLMGHLVDEHRHFAYLEDAIEGRAWRQRPSGSPA